MADKMVTVRIEATQKVRYSQVRKIKKSEFEKYEKMVEGTVINDRDFNDAFEHLLDYDVFDADDLQDLTIELAE